MEIGSESVVAIAIALPVVLLAAYIIGRVARLLLRGRVQVSSSTTTVLSVLGISGGLLIAGLVSDVRPWSPLALLLALGVTMLLLSVFAALAARMQHPVPREPVLELIQRGESDRLEFKSSARWNLHTRSRDDRIEMVIAKAIAGFSNTEGGTLLIGVNDAGEVVGLANDFAVMKAPDTDRFELWLRDFLATTLGQNAAAAPVVDFTEVTVDNDVTYVCRVTCPSSPAPGLHPAGEGRRPVRTLGPDRQLHPAAETGRGGRLRDGALADGSRPYGSCSAAGRIPRLRQLSCDRARVSSPRPRPWRPPWTPWLHHWWTASRTPTRGAP